MKILIIVIVIWIIYLIKQFISNIQISNRKNKKKENISDILRKDIQDADFEELE